MKSHSLTSSTHRRGLLSAMMLLSLLPMVSSHAEEDAVPQAYPSNRYEPLWKKSPFTLSSAADAQATGGFADNLALTGILRIGDTSYVAVLDKTSRQRQLISAQPNDQGIQLLKLESSTDLTKVTATLKKGDETSTLHYDLAYLQQTTNASVAMAPPVPILNQAPPIVAPGLIPIPPPQGARPIIRRIIVPSRPIPAQ